MLALATSASASLWCFATSALCDNKFDDCAYDAAQGKYCGVVTSGTHQGTLW